MTLLLTNSGTPGRTAIGMSCLSFASLWRTLKIAITAGERIGQVNKSRKNCSKEEVKMKADNDGVIWSSRYGTMGWFYKKYEVISNSRRQPFGRSRYIDFAPFTKHLLCNITNQQRSYDELFACTGWIIKTTCKQISAAVVLMYQNVLEYWWKGLIIMIIIYWLRIYIAQSTRVL